MSGAVRGSDLVDPPPVTRNPPPQRAREGRWLSGIGGHQPSLETVAVGSDEPEQNRQRRLPTSRLVRTDHALRDAGPLGEPALRHPGALPRLPHKAARRLDDRHPLSEADRQYSRVSIWVLTHQRAGIQERHLPQASLMLRPRAVWRS